MTPTAAHEPGELLDRTFSCTGSTSFCSWHHGRAYLMLLAFHSRRCHPRGCCRIANCLLWFCYHRSLIGGRSGVAGRHRRCSIQGPSRARAAFRAFAGIKGRIWGLVGIMLGWGWPLDRISVSCPGIILALMWAVTIPSKLLKHGWWTPCSAAPL